MRARVKVRGVNGLLRNIKIYGKEMEKAERNAVQAAGNYLLGRIKRSMSHRGPEGSQGIAGSPYSKQKYPSGIPRSLVSPLSRYAIRKRTGNLLKALHGRFYTYRDGAGYVVGMNESKMPKYGVYIFKGTRIMHARDPITALSQDKRVKKKMREIMIEELSKPQRRNYAK